MVEPLTTIQLDNILLNVSVTREKYIGAYPSCIFPKSRKKMYAFISNTDEHDESGQHWCAWVVKDETIYFFDSFGREPTDETLPVYFKDIIKEFKHIQYTNTRIQGWSSKACGYFCTHFIYVICLGLDYDDFLNDYTRNFIENDIVAFQFVSSII